MTKSELEKIAYGDVCIRQKKQRRKRQKSLVTEMLYDYAENSTLHGLRYIVQRGLNIVEKLFWFITVVISMVLCSMYISSTYQKWITSPVIVTVNERLSSVGTVPFPSVTICPEAKINNHKYNFKEKNLDYAMDSLHGEDLIRFEHINSICLSGFKMNSNNYTLTNATIIRDITEVAPPQEDMFYSCRWHSDIRTRCTDLFRRTYTEDGVCYTANSLAASEIFQNTIQSEYPYMKSDRLQVGWSHETGFDYSLDDSDSYPKRGLVLGTVPDMELIMVDASRHVDHTCNSLYSGYKIYLQHPADLPQSSLYYYGAVSNQVTSLAISFHEFNSDSGLSIYSPEIRQCYFPNERKLRYFKLYTAKNCQAECLSNYTFSSCKCVGFYMPHDNSSEICYPNNKNVLCMIRVKVQMARREMKADVGLNEKACRCLPACNTVEYDAEILKTEYYFRDIDRQLTNTNRSLPYLRIDLYFKKPQFVTMRRREVFGVTDLLANIGGLMGLFHGFSVLSLIEIFYFLTLRVGFLFKRDLDELKSKETSVLKKT